jgi:hypothetical protein
MGMFDYVRSELPLPDGFAGELQSKDFDCAMTTVLIRADGRLMIEDSDWETVPPAERPYPDPADPCHFIGSMRTVNRRWRDLDYHGDFTFYGNEGCFNAGTAIWHEYTARFSEGRLSWIRCVPEPATEQPLPSIDR